MNGNCFQVATHIILNSTTGCDDQTRASVEEAIKAIGQCEVVLAHGTVTRAKDGHKHQHAWVEEDGENSLRLVFDFSNGINVVLPAAVYYAFGKVENVKRYTLLETVSKLIEHEHYGPWEEEKK